MILKNCDSESKASLVIHLSEDVTIDAILASNFEDFSARLAEIKF